MKRSKWMTLLSILLILCMAVQPVSAAGRRNNNSRNNKQSYSAEVRRGNNKKNVQKEKEETETVTEEESTVSTEAVAVMSLVEDETTVENGEMLRASTYSLMTADETSGTTDEGTAQAAGTVLKYFSATLYDYDQETINAATDALDDDTTVREGIYFSDGLPGITKETTVDKSAFVAGQYYIQNIRAAENNVGSWLYSVANDTSIRATTEQSEATLWTLVVEDDNYYLMSGDKYLVVGTDGNTDGLDENKTAITISSFSGNAEGVQLSQNGYYLCQWGSADSIYYGGYGVNNDAGNGMRFYRVDGETQTLTTIVETETITEGYERWNLWNKGTGNNVDGQKIYTGLVERSLDVNKDIVFTKPEGGIFNSDEDVKKIYPDVEIPFVYKDGYYTFDASVNGVYLKEDTNQKSTATAEKTLDANQTPVTPRLYFDEGNPQSNGGTYGDGSSTVWAPFNNSTSLTEGTMNYHFGMRATIPFSMTPNGRVVATDDTSDVIEFSFSGDDDVWVFIDGQLVIDLGGIHNRLDAKIDFAANTVTYSANNDLEVETGSYNDEDFALEQILFGNLISQDRVTFAATDTHELTIFYLERGKGASNSKIEFNLPVNDTVVVTKDATRSWNEEDQVVTPLTIAEQAIVDNIAFGFTLYRSVDNGVTFEAVANTNYYLLNANNQVISNPTTSSEGYFELKNGQSAKFITTQMDSEEYDVIYYVKEHATDGFTEPDYNYSGEAAGGYRYKTTGYTDPVTGKVFQAIDQAYAKASLIPEYEVYDGTGNSGQVTVYGSDESEDSLTFICSNFLDAQLPNPSARPVEDKIVIDYGLPVEIDVLANDVYRGEKIELISVTGDGLEVDSKTGAITTAGSTTVYGDAVIENGKIKYTLNKQLSGVEVLNYLVKVTGTETNDTTGITTVECEYAVAKVYVIPATTMYYEENFAGLVTYTGSCWDANYTVDANYQNELQEPGVVGTIGDSPYGSDVAYLNDSKDSNGTSRYANTKTSTVKFEYSFTGTGTSFFARTTNNTGYMRVTVKDAAGDIIQSIYRDTVYITEDATATLYNVPVFTTDELDYGTYTVTVMVAKENTAVGYHSDFWLDGIRIVEPLEEVKAVADTDENYANYQKYVVATTAYATDGEQNMKNVTLRNKLIREADYDESGNPVWSEDGNFVFFTDIDGAIDTAEEYESIGPKEEVYLNKGQSVTFSLTDWDPNSNKVYLGMKAPFGSGTASVGSTSVSVNNAADCYYDISNYGTITTDNAGVKTATFTITAADGLISVTNIKVTGTSKFTIIQSTDTKANNVEITEGENGTDVAVDGSEAEGSDS